MTNAEIICNEAVASGFYTEEEVEELLSDGEMPKLHTYAFWKSIGFVPVAGSHGWPCKLWLKKKSKSEIDEQEASEEERKRDFYLTKSFLFHISQVQKIEEK